MRSFGRIVGTLFGVWAAAVSTVMSQSSPIGREVAVAHHLDEAVGEEYSIPLNDLIAHGQKLFTAVWTGQEGGGRPLTKGTGNPLSNGMIPLLFPRNFNRISAPDANSCSGCHNVPVLGGGGDIVANVFVLGQRFDFATFDGNETLVDQGRWMNRTRRRRFNPLPILVRRSACSGRVISRCWRVR
jgi:hypothetical protein